MSQKEKLLNKMSDEDLRASAHSVLGATPGNGADREELVRVLRESLSVQEIKSKLRKTSARTSGKLVSFFLISLIVYSSLVVGLGLISSGQIVTQSLAPDWNRTYRQISSEYSMTCAQQTSEGGYIFVGTGDLFPIYGILLLKTDSEGNAQWNGTFAGRAASVSQSSDGGYIIGGSTPQWVSWFAKVFSNGTLQWNKTYAPGSYSQATYARETSDGGYIGVGWMGSGTAWLVKMSPLGDMEWNKTITGQYYRPCFVQQITGGRYIVAGTYISPVSDSPIQSYFWLARTDLNGNLEWSRTYGERGYQDAHYAQQTSDGGFIIVGDTRDSNWGCWLVKTDSEGNAQWKHAYGDSALNTACFVQQTSDGGYVVAGGTYSFPEQPSWDEDILLFKTTRYGAMEWLATFGGPGYGEAVFVTELAYDTYAVAGSMVSIQNYLSFFLAQIRKPLAGEVIVAVVVVLLGPGLIIAGTGLIQKRERLKTVRKVPA